MPALGHLREREFRHHSRVFRARCGMVPQQQLDRIRVREFRRSAEAAVLAIEHSLERIHAVLDRLAREVGWIRAPRRLGAPEHRHQLEVLRADLGLVLVVEAAYALQQVAESGQPKRVVFGK
jgi:hypothetical protein